MIETLESQFHSSILKSIHFHQPLLDWVNFKKGTYHFNITLKKNLLGQSFVLLFELQHKQNNLYHGISLNTFWVTPGLHN